MQHCALHGAPVGLHVHSIKRGEWDVIRIGFSRERNMLLGALSACPFSKALRMECNSN